MFSNKFLNQKSILNYTDEEQKNIGSLNLAIYEKIAKEDTIKINYANFNKLPVFIRIIVHHNNLNKTIISDIVRYLYTTYETVGPYIKETSNTHTQIQTKRLSGHGQSQTKRNIQ